MPRPEERYTAAQRHAVAAASLDLGVTHKRVVELAAEGKLTHDGLQLAPFDVAPSYVGTLKQREAKRRAGRRASSITEEPHRDATETLRRRALILAEDHMRHLERKKRGTVTAAEIREAARMIQAVMALPERTDPPPPAPGQRVDGRQQGSQVRDGKLGPLLTDHRATHGRGTAPTPHPPPQDTEEAETHAQPNSATHHDDPDTEPADDHSPGHVVRGLAAVVRAPSHGG